MTGILTLWIQLERKINLNLGRVESIWMGGGVKEFEWRGGGKEIIIGRVF